MKKAILLLALCCAIVAQASVYNYLVFTNKGGSTTAFSVKDLTLKVNGGELQVSNNDGTVNLVMTELATMQFSESENVTALENVLNGDEPVQVYHITGVLLGTYGSIVEAAQVLNAGTYVISNGSVTQRIVIQ